MKRTYTPSLEEISRKLGERYFTVTVGKRHQPHAEVLEYGDLETIIDMIETTIYSIDPAADLDKWSARISYEGRDLVIMRNCSGPDSAEVLPQPAGDRYEVREVDAWAEYDDHDDPDETPAWIWNTSYHLGEFTTMSDPASALRRYLKERHGITFNRGTTATVYDGDVYEIIDRATRQPLFAAIPQS